jgi:hypothetical protein
MMTLAENKNQKVCEMTKLQQPPPQTQQDPFRTPPQLPPPNLQPQSKPATGRPNLVENQTVWWDRLSNALFDRKPASEKYRANNKTENAVEEIIGRHSLSQTNALPILKSLKDNSESLGSIPGLSHPTTEEMASLKSGPIDNNYDIFATIDIEKPGPELKMLNWEDLSSAPDFLNKQYLEDLRKMHENFKRL